MNNLIPGVALSQLTQPAATIIYNEEADGYGLGTDDASFVSTLSWNDPTIRHNGGSVAAFCDGHVKWFIKGKIDVPDNPTGDPRYEL